MSNKLTKDKAFATFTELERLRVENDLLREKLDFRRQVGAYLHDPQFHGLVDMLDSMLMEGSVSVLELRAAVSLASNKFWERGVRERQFVIHAN